MSEETSVGSVLSKDQEDCKSEIKRVQPKSRYRGDHHHVTSTHDYCKYEKKCDQNDAVKPWKMVMRRRSVEGSNVAKVETSGLRRHSLGSRLENSVDAKRDVLAVKKKPFASVKNVTSSISEIARSVDGSSVKSKANASKNVTNKKAKTQTVRVEDVKEKTMCVVESIIKVVHSNKQPSPERTRVTLGEHLNFKRGKVLETKLEDSCEGSKCDKVVLRHQKVVKEKKIMTLINNVIEETMIKLMKLKKTKVEALIGAFETVIQDTKKSQHIRSKTTTSKKVLIETERLRVVT